jgi:hypothetical protein
MLLRAVFLGRRMREATVAGKIPRSQREAQRRYMLGRITDPDWRPWREPAPGLAGRREAARRGATQARCGAVQGGAGPSRREGGAS